MEQLIEFINTLGVQTLKCHGFYSTVIKDNGKSVCLYSTSRNLTWWEKEGAGGKIIEKAHQLGLRVRNNYGDTVIDDSPNVEFANKKTSAFGWANI